MLPWRREQELEGDRCMSHTLGPPLVTMLPSPKRSMLGSKLGLMEEDDKEGWKGKVKEQKMEEGDRKLSCSLEGLRKSR